MIRPATLADLPALRALEQELFGPDAWSEELIRQEIDGLGRRFVVADDLSGYAVTMTAGDIVDLLRIGVRPDARRTGLASRLLDELLVDTEGASRMLLEVSVTNAPALGFYVARQFSVIDVRPHYDLVGVDKEQSEERARLRPTQGDFDVSVRHLERSQDPELHPPASRPGTLTGCCQVETGLKRTASIIGSVS